MLKKLYQDNLKRLKKVNPRLLLAIFMGFVLLLTIIFSYMSSREKPINPKAFKPLLNLIGRAESGDNYNAYFGNSKNTEINFTSMTIEEVMSWQKDFVSQGSPSSAVGRYQIINKTLVGLVNQLGIDKSEKFDKSMQNKLAIALLERRGAKDFVNDRITREEFAFNLSKEWAALPKVLGDNPNQSFYAEDGLNKSRVAITEVLRVIDHADS